MAIVTFSGGVFHLQIQWATVSYKMKMSFCKKKKKKNPAAFSQLQQRNWVWWRVGVLSVCAKMSRGFWIWLMKADTWVKWNPLVKARISIMGLDVEYIRRSGWCMCICMWQSEFYFVPETHSQVMWVYVKYVWPKNIVFVCTSLHLIVLLIPNFNWITGKQYYN